MMIRTQEEILERIEQRKDSGLLVQFEIGDYVDCLDYEHAKRFLKEGVTKEQWQPTVQRPMQIDDRAKDYLSFFKEKIDDERGLSVVRAYHHYIAWKWLLGHPDADDMPTGGAYEIRLYEYLRKQIRSGEWDRLTEAAFDRIAITA